MSMGSTRNALVEALQNGDHLRLNELAKSLSSTIGTNRATALAESVDAATLRAFEAAGYDTAGKTSAAELAASVLAQLSVCPEGDMEAVDREAIRGRAAKDLSALSLKLFEIQHKYANDRARLALEAQKIDLAQVSTRLAFMRVVQTNPGNMTDAELMKAAGVDSYLTAEEIADMAEDDDASGGEPR